MRGWAHGWRCFRPRRSLRATRSLSCCTPPCRSWRWTQVRCAHRLVWWSAVVVGERGLGVRPGRFLVPIPHCAFDTLEAYNNAPHVTPEGEPAIQSAPCPLSVFSSRSDVDHVLCSVLTKKRRAIGATRTYACRGARHRRQRTMNTACGVNAPRARRMERSRVATVWRPRSVIKLRHVWPATWAQQPCPSS